MKNAVAKRRHSKYDVNVPKDFHWKTFGALVAGLEIHLDELEKSRVHAVLRSRNLDQLYSLSDDWGAQSITSQPDITEEKFFAKYQISAYLKKFPFTGNSAIRRQTALTGFFAAEEVCKKANARLHSTGIYPSSLPRNPLKDMRRFVRIVLGDTVPLDEVSYHMRHGPGSSLCTSKGRVTTYYKYRDLPYTVSRDAWAYARAAILCDPRWYGAVQEDYRKRNNIPFHMPISQDHLFEKTLKVVDGNRITFVPKDGRKDRSIAIEPRMNLFLQLGVDGYIRKRLKRFGCNLDSQTKNQRFAFLGSTPADGRNFATIDLAAASDTVSLKLCEAVLPREWYAFLCDLRSAHGAVAGSDGTFSYEKMSSMGNGFTFALESLIFLAAAFAAKESVPGCELDIRRDIAVYGDDLVVPSSIADNLVSILTYCGFSLNLEKSFFTGGFRESCGKDYFRGTLVRPLFLSNNIRHIKELFSVINRVSLLQFSQTEEEGLNVDLAPLIELYRGWVPRKWLTFTGPPSREEFDTYLHIAVNARCNTYHRFTGWQYSFRRLITKPIQKSGKNFLYRKLMSNLGHGHTPSIWELKPWDPTSILGGNVFTVTQRNAVTVGVVKSRSSYWSEDYSSCRFSDPRIA